MKFNCKKAALIEAVSAVQRGVAARSTNPVLQGILFSVEDQELRATATNSEISVRAVVPAEIEESGKIVLNAGLISEIFKKLSGDTVFFESIDPLQVKVECQLSSFVINGLDPEGFPQFPVIEEEYAVRVQADVLKSLIHRTVFSVATNDSMPVLTGIKIEITDHKIALISLDGYRLAYCSSDIGSKTEDDLSVIIPGKSMQELDRVLSGKKDPISIKFSKTQILFEIGNIRFASRLLEGEFINYNNILSVDIKAEAIAERKLLLESCERAAVLAKEGKNNLVVMDLTVDRLEMTSSSDIGDAKEVVPIRLSGEDMKIAFNSRYVLDVLKAIDDEKIKLKLSSSVGPAIIVSEDGSDDYRFLMLPVRVAETDG